MAVAPIVGDLIEVKPGLLGSFGMYVVRSVVAGGFTVSSTDEPHHLIHVQTTDVLRVWASQDNPTPTQDVAARSFTAQSGSGPYVSDAQAGGIHGNLQVNKQTPTEAVLVSGVDASAGDDIYVTLTANRAVGVPLNPVTGKRLYLVFTQDATGSRTLTWNAVFKTTWQPTPAPSSISSIDFTYDGTNWQQVGQAPFIGRYLDWGGDVYNAMAIGAVGDGVANDQTPVAATITAAGAGCAEFPGPKTYLFNTTLVAGVSQQVSGTSRVGSVLKQANGSNLAPTLYGNAGSHLRDFTLDGNKANNATAGTGVYVSGVARFSAENIRLLNVKGDAVRFDGADCSLIASHIETPDGHAISSNGATRLRLIGNRIDTPGGSGYKPYDGGASSFIHLIGNAILNPGNIGVAYSTTNSWATSVGNSISSSGTANHCLDHGSLVDGATVANLFNGGAASTSIDSAQRIAYVANIGRGANNQGLQVFNSNASNGTQLTGRDVTAGLNVMTNCQNEPYAIDGTNHVILVGNIGKGNLAGGGDGVRISKFNTTITTRSLLLGNMIYDDQRVKTQAYGVGISAAVTGSVAILHNDLRGNLTGAINDLAPDVYTHGNFGYNPRGALTPPAIPATTVIFQNPFNVDCTVYIAGGTLTAIGIGGLPVPANWGAQPTTTTASTGGTLVPATYYYRCAARNAAGHTAECVEFSQVVGAGTNTNIVTITFPTGAGLRGLTGWDVYGRTTGAETLMAANCQTPTFIDDGSVTPSGAMPGTDTTGNTATGITAAAAAGAVHTLRVLYGQSIKLTYSVAPTWTWFGE